MFIGSGIDSVEAYGSGIDSVETYGSTADICYVVGHTLLWNSNFLPGHVGDMREMKYVCRILVGRTYG